MVFSRGCIVTAIAIDFLSRRYPCLHRRRTRATSVISFLSTALRGTHDIAGPDMRSTIKAKSRATAGTRKARAPAWRGSASAWPRESVRGSPRTPSRDRRRLVAPACADAIRRNSRAHFADRSGWCRNGRGAASSSRRARSAALHRRAGAASTASASALASSAVRRLRARPVPSET